MKLLKKSLALALALVLVFAVAACAADPAPAPAPAPADPAPEATPEPAPEADPEPAPEPAPEADETLLIGFSAMDGHNPFFVALEDAARQIIEAAGHDFIALNPAMDNETQLSQIEDMIAMGIDALLLAPVSTDGIPPALMALQNAGVPVINFDSRVAQQDFDAGLVRTFVGSDNFNAGYVVGRDLVERFPDGGQIALLPSPTHDSVVQRMLGFHSALEGHDQFEIVFEQDGLGQTAVAEPLAADAITAFPDLIAIIAGNDPSALGALSAALAAGRTDIAIYGVDGAPGAKQAMAEAIGTGGGFMGSGAQSPITIGEWSAEYTLRLLVGGEDIPRDVPVVTFIINQDNVLDFDLDGWQ